jgi:hypothetical protein
MAASRRVQEEVVVVAPAYAPCAYASGFTVVDAYTEQCLTQHSSSICALRSVAN